jgi:hypothetical protein
MIAKTFLLAKTFRAHSTNFLRQEKSLRDQRAMPHGLYDTRVILDLGEDWPWIQLTERSSVQAERVHAFPFQW